MEDDSMNRVLLSLLLGFNGIVGHRTKNHWKT